MCARSEERRTTQYCSCHIYMVVVLMAFSPVKYTVKIINYIINFTPKINIAAWAYAACYGKWHTIC